MIVEKIAQEEKLVVEQKDTMEYVNNMAVICYMRNDYKQAMKYFKKALKLNPGDELIKANIEYLEDVLKNAK